MPIEIVIGWFFFLFKHLKFNYMKTYVLTVSTKFPQTHPKKGEDTEFVEKILMMCSQNEMFW